jgi:hypothetical protein
MGSRTVRLRQQDLPDKSFSIKVGTEIQVVLHNGKTLIGKLAEANLQALVITEPNVVWYNANNRQQSLNWQDIQEVEYNLPTPY